MTMKARIFYLLLFLTLAPMQAGAQIDAIIDAVVDAVEPTPVYDTDLTIATEQLVDKIDRLNKVLFGGSEATSAGYRYMTMYSDITELTEELYDYVRYTYSSARMIESYCQAIDRDFSGGSYSLRNINNMASTAWNTYEYSKIEIQALLELVLKIFNDSSKTNSQVHESIQEALEKTKEMKRQRIIETEAAIFEVTEAVGLMEAAEVLTLGQEEYARVNRETFGDKLDSQKDSDSHAGRVGSFIIMLIGGVCLLYVAYGCVQMMRKAPDAGRVMGRAFTLLIISFVVILVIQRFLP